MTTVSSRICFTGYGGRHGGPTLGESQVPLAFSFLGADQQFVADAVQASVDRQQDEKKMSLQTYNLTTIVVDIVKSVRGPSQ